MDALPLHASCYYGRYQGLGGTVYPSVSLKVSHHCGQVCRRRFSSNVVYAFSDPSKSKGGEQGQHTQRTRTSSLGEQREERKKPFRLKGRWRLAARRLRRLSPSSVLRSILAYARTHSKQAALSTLLGCTLAMGCLCLKLTTVPTPHFVPYSELVNHLRAGSVMSALFEEGSRRLFFDLKPIEGEAASAREVLAVANSNDADPQGKKVGELVGTHAEQLKATFPSDKVLPKRLQTELSALKSVMDEDMLKHWVTQVGTRTTRPQPSPLTIAETGKGVDGLFEGDTSLGTGEPSLVLSSPTSVQVSVSSDGPKTPSASAAVAAFSSSLKAIAGAPEQLLKTQSHPWRYATRRIDNDEAYLLSLMREKGVTYSSSPQPMGVALRTTLITIFSLWIPLTPLFWLMYRQFSGGNSSSQKRRSNSPSVKFDDVAGVDEARTELMEIVSYLRGALNFRRLGAKLPKGILLVGPPGTGKTLLARAVSGEAGVPFFAASASEFVEMFVGRGAARIRDLFNAARKCSPSIIFIDELDAVGGRRGRSFNDERDQTLNQLLTEMDGFESDTGVLVIAATNRPEALDPALCRPGRFSRKVFVKEPDVKGREQILAVHMRGVPIEGDVEFVKSMLASITGGFVGADLANVVNEAALLAVREGRSVVTLEDLKTAVMRVKFGVGNKPALYGALDRVADWLQPKASKPPPAGG
ncbi:hypothetical protein GOP47_0023725 [Adiantum capillus-veneris]|uniref:AAA+ ATPase domain-containing protein n=1 Tax=Adiantum capillus-veneris TaxID=13818 RepID=A0A9D4U4I4_ADICA|nr:hypothetical protein GOP47_0023725 [Adiantum capillus-veneris]